MSIRRLLGDNGYGGGAELDDNALAAFLRSSYVMNEDQNKRRERARLLHRYYSGTGDTQIENMIGSVFKDKEIIAKRQEWVSFAKYCNVIRRVVHEKSTAYSEPARRTVDGDENQKLYAGLLEACGMHQAAIQVNRWLNLHWTLAVGFRVRQLADDHREPVIDVVTPDRFWAVCHPADRTRLVALIIEMQHAGPNVSSESKYLVWTDTESFRLSTSGYLMKETWQDNPFGRIPYVLAGLSPSTTCLVEEWVNEDLRAAQESVWFEHVCMLKESKSATKIPVFAGDLTTMARGQVSDTEGGVHTPDGAAVNVIDMSMDLSMFRDTARFIYETAAANHGLAPSLLTHQGVQSADARELMRVPLRELRLEQQVPLRRFERAFAEIMSLICDKDLPAFAFKMEGWRIDFGESQTPLGRKESLEVFEHERKLGLTSTPKEKVRRNPDLDIDSALEEIAADVVLEQARIELMKPMMVASGEAQGDSRLSPEEQAMAADTNVTSNGRP